MLRTCATLLVAQRGHGVDSGGADRGDQPGGGGYGRDEYTGDGYTPDDGHLEDADLGPRQNRGGHAAATKEDEKESAQRLSDKPGRNRSPTIAHAWRVVWLSPSN